MVNRIVPKFFWSGYESPYAHVTFVEVKGRTQIVTPWMEPEEDTGGSSEWSIGSILRCRDTDKKLESAVFNCISLGQWETARAHFRCLAQEPSSRDNARELLKILVLESSSFW